MIIKCPECGHQVSDKAPVCPSCGVEIAGKIIRCPNCGEIHFISDGICPNCHHSLTSATTDNDKPNASVATTEPDTLEAEEEIEKEEASVDEPDDSDYDDDGSEPVRAVPLTKPTHKYAPSTTTATPVTSDKPATGQTKPAEKKNHAALIISFIVAAVLCLALLYAYNSANQSNEAREYQNAIESRNPAILQSYLSTYTNAPTAHRDSVKVILNSLRSTQTTDTAWDSAKKSNNADELKAYLQQNPNSPHRQEAENMIDELDWKAALQSHDFANYLSLHQNGQHASEAVDSVRLTMDLPATDADKQKATNAVRKFLVAINAHSNDRVRECVADQLSYFNEKSQVSGNEALNYMAIIYKDAERLNWHVDNPSAATVSKKGNGQSAQYSVTMPARLSVNYNSGKNVQSKFKIQANINSSGKITAIRLIRLAEEKPKPSETKKTESKTTDKKPKTEGKTQTKK